MRKPLIALIALAAGLALGLGGRSALRSPKAPSGPFSWHRDASGFKDATEIGKTNAKPMLVYFYTDW